MGSLSSKSFSQEISEFKTQLLGQTVFYYVEEKRDYSRPTHSNGFASAVSSLTLRSKSVWNTEGNSAPLCDPRSVERVWVILSSSPSKSCLTCYQNSAIIVLPLPPITTPTQPEANREPSSKGSAQSALGKVCDGRSELGACGADLNKNAPIWTRICSAHARKRWRLSA